MTQLMPGDTSSGSRARLIAVVDDDYRVLEALGDLLQSSGYRTTLHASAESFLAAPERGDVALLVSDIGLPGISGTELIRHLWREPHRLPAILVTGRTEAHFAEEARAMGVPLFAKPFDAVELLRIVAIRLQD